MSNVVEPGVALSNARVDRRWGGASSMDGWMGCLSRPSSSTGVGRRRATTTMWVGGVSRVHAVDRVVASRRVVDDLRVMMMMMMMMMMMTTAAHDDAMHDDRVYREPRRRRRDDDNDDDNDDADDARRAVNTERKPPPDVSHLTSVKVDNLDYSMTVDDVREAFASYGAIGDVYMPREHGTGRSRGFGFVRYERKEDADAAVAGMHEREVRGRAIRCAVAERGRGEFATTRPHTNGGGAYRSYGSRYDGDRRRDGGRGYRDDRYGRDDYDRYDRYDDRRDRDERRYDDRRSDDRYDDRGGRSYHDRYDRYDDRRRSYDDRRDTYRDDRRRDGDRRDSYRDDRRRDDAPRHHPYERDSRAPPSSVAEPRDIR